MQIQQLNQNEERKHNDVKSTYLCATLTPGVDNVINDELQELLNTDQKSWFSYQPNILTQLGVK